MTTLLILASVIGAAFVLGVITYWGRSRKHNEPIQLDVGRKLSH
jgi:hypothetical protein